MLPFGDTRDGLIASILIVAAGCVLRLVWLDADVDYYGWIGYLTDEGRWVENARNFVLFGDALFPRGNVHLWIAPLFQCISYVSFVVFDISRLWVRMFPALCGCAMLLMIWTTLRRHVSPYALAVGLALVAVQEDLVMLSRVSIPEIPAMLIELSVFLTLLSARDRFGRTLLAGGLMVICVAMKATTAPMFVVFGIVAWCTGLPEMHHRRRRLLAFWTPALILGVLAVLVALAANLISPAVIVEVTNIVSFVALNNVYGMISFPFDNPLAPTVNIWLLGAWLGVLVALLAPELNEGPARRWLVASAIWAAGYALLIMLLTYFPNRYKAHLLIPLAILVTFSVHNFLQLGLTGIQQRISELSPRRRLVACGVLALPSAVLFSPILVWFLSRVGFEADGVSWKILAIGAGWLLATLILHRQDSGRSVLAVPVPIAASAAWLAGHYLLDWEFWLAAGEYGPLIRWVTVLGAAFVFAWWLVHPKAVAIKSGRLALATAVAYIAISVWPYAASLVWPQFTLRDASRDLGASLADSTDIASYRADGLFVDNRLPYMRHSLRGWSKDGWTEAPPQIAVSWEWYQTSTDRRFKQFLDDNYQPGRSYLLNSSSRYGPAPARVTVYRLIK